MALKIGVGLSYEDNPYFAGKDASFKALSSLGVDIPELGLAFSHHEYPLLQVYDGIKSSLGEKNLVVIDSQGNILGNLFKKKSIVLALFSDQFYYHSVSLIKNVSENPYIAGHHLAWGLLDVLGSKTGGKEILRKLALIFASDSVYSKELLLKGIQEVLGVRFPIVGGIVSGASPLNPGLLTFNREINLDSVVGILLAGENLIIGIGSYHGWFPLGLAKKIKKVEKNRILELEDVTPLKYYIQYLGDNIDISREDIYSTSVIYPLGIEFEKDKYLLRFPRNFEPGGSVTLDSQLSEGQLLRLMMGTREELLDTSKKAIDSALKPFEEEKVLPQLIIIISGIERKEILGIDINQEINFIRNKVPETTRVLGLYTYGQFGLYGSSMDITSSFYHNGSIIIVALGLKKV